MNKCAYPTQFNLEDGRAISGEPCVVAYRVYSMHNPTGKLSTVYFVSRVCSGWSSQPKETHLIGYCVLLGSCSGGGDNMLY